MFWGIEGVSRGATPGSTAAGPGTFLSVCTGTNIPVGTGNLPPAPGSPSCSNAFPQRLYPIASTSTSTSSGVTTLTIVINSVITAYQRELVMVKAPGGAPPNGDNGTFAIQSIVGGQNQTSLKVTVPALTATCSMNCGNAILGTPILGFASSSKAYNDATCFTGLCSGFGEHIKNLGFNCQSYDGCIGWQNLYAQEESGADTFVVDFFNFVGVDVHGGPSRGSQNFGPVLNAEIYTGTGNSACGFGTTGMYIGDAEMRGLNGWTINNSAESGSAPACANTPTDAVLFEAPNTEVSNGHCEGFANCILMGANNAPGSGNVGASSQKISAVTGGPACSSGTCSVVHISNNYPNNTDYTIENVRRNVFSNTIQDDVNGITLGSSGNDTFTALYSWASGINNSPSTSTTNILTTDPSTRNRFDAGVRTGTIESGVSTNSDLAGQCAIGGFQVAAVLGSQIHTPTRPSAPAPTQAPRRRFAGFKSQPQP